MVSFNEAAGFGELYSDNIMLVDFLNLSFRFKHNNTVAPFSPQMMRLIQSLARSYQCGSVVICADFGSSSYRKDISGGAYKGDRAKKRENQTEEERQEFLKFLENYEEAYEFCTSTGYHGVRLKNVEADDTIGYLARELSKSDDVNNVWIVSTDTDMDQLLTENVSRFSYKTRKEYTIHNFYEEHGCDTPEEYTSLKALMGDKGDSVAGIPSIAQKRGYGLIREYGSAMEIYDNLPLKGTQQFIKNLNESGDLIPLNLQLMDLATFCDEAIAYPDPNNLIIMENVYNELIRKAASA